ncbi:MAG: hypothetical protein LBQ12_12050 [Deltaproteobacteria bacterium]|jgi:hypothetical protein|nr:hypothetical protein [Deltaproteobacteria bacterium]
MFKRLKSRTDPRRLGDVYTRWDFALTVLQRLVEAGFLVCLLFFLADSLWAMAGRLAPGVAGDILASIFAVAAYGLARVPVGLLRGSLDSAFGIDPRPFRARARAAAAKFAIFLPVGAAGTVALYASLPVLGPLAWAGTCLALVWLALALWLMLPRVAVLSDAKLRKPEEGEIPPGAAKYLKALSSGPVKIGPEDVLVSTAFYPGLPQPYPMAGKILVPEKALGAFPPKALEIRLAAAALCRVVSSARSLTILRFFSMSLAVPASLILLNSVGILFGYPVMVKPELTALVWAGVWASYWFSEFAALFVERTISARVSATVAAVTLDARSLFESVELTARANLDPSSQTPFLDLFRPRQNPVSQFESIRKSIREMVEAAAKRRAAAGAGTSGGGGRLAVPPGPDGEKAGAGAKAGKGAKGNGALKAKGPNGNGRAAYAMDGGGPGGDGEGASGSATASGPDGPPVVLEGQGKSGYKN